MLIADYAAFVARTDLSKTKPDERFDIALYGLVGEIGSLVAAIKKRLLAVGRTDWNLPNEEIVEELGDCIWYCFAIGCAVGLGAEFLRSDIEALRAEVGGEDDRARRIRQVLGTAGGRFLAEAPAFLQAFDKGTATLDDYRRVAFLTSRTKEDQLVEVCLAVLQQLTAEIFRAKLPAIEKELNRWLPDRPVETVLGEIAWHLAALASLYRIDLGEVTARNVRKLERRFGRGIATPLHDEDRPETERLPRHFEVAFVSVGPGRSRMYMDGRRLGDDLTDNAYAEDGYRFHDVMHLALAAKLGWSPVLRKLMGRKRRSDPRLDEVEDGARAMIVEEAIIKAIHSEGVRVAALAAPPADGGARPLFAGSGDISFAFLKRLESFASGLEVAESRYWEWEDAIIRGFEIFQRLRVEQRGTVEVDLERRTLAFSPRVFTGFQGSVAGVGAASSAGELKEGTELDTGERKLAAIHGAEIVHALRRSVLRALNLDMAAGGDLRIGGWRDGLVDVLAQGSVQSEMWRRGIVAFRTAADDDGARTTVTTLAVSDP